MAPPRQRFAALLLTIGAALAPVPGRAAAAGGALAIDPIAVGHERLIEGAAGGRPQVMRTLSLDPPVFLLPGFLSAAEAEELVEAGRAKPKDQWLSSQTSAGDAEELLQELKEGMEEGIRFADRDGDGHLTAEEMTLLMRDGLKLNFDAADFAAFVAHAHPEAASADRISVKRFKKASPAKYLANLIKAEPHRRERFSEQVWMKYKGPLLKTLLNRTAAVTGFPPEVVSASEDLQVVRYPELGHYACHHDSSPDSIQEGEIRLGTLGMFLNDVPQGGETAFPGADADTAGWDDEAWSMFEAECQSTPKCTSMGGLVVPPVKGDAIFWYNVKPNKISGILAGEKRGKHYGDKTVLWSSMHCGAEVKEGEKWFANLWLRPPDKKRRRKQRDSEL